jgi:hypothetical protein
MNDAFSSARQFVLSDARLLEQRMCGTLFDGEPVSGVIDALTGYRNADGGFGHGLEPDTQCPASLPVDVEFALQTLVTTGANGNDVPWLGDTISYIAQMASGGDHGAAVPLATPIIESYPRAGHWTEWTYEPALNPTAGLAGLFTALNVAHPWRDAATAWCWERIDHMGVPDAPHTLLEVLTFLAHVDDASRADAVAANLATHFGEIPGVLLDPNAEGYGLTPLHFVPTASARWRTLFRNDHIDAALDHLARQQQEDGGWPVTWEAPSAASALAWRGHVTVQSVHTLASFGRLTVRAQ